MVLELTKFPANVCWVNAWPVLTPALSINSIGLAKLLQVSFKTSFLSEEVIRSRLLPGQAPGCPKLAGTVNTNYKTSVRCQLEEDGPFSDPSAERMSPTP